MVEVYSWKPRYEDLVSNPTYVEKGNNVEITKISGSVEAC